MSAGILAAPRRRLGFVTVAAGILALALPASAETLSSAAGVIGAGVFTDRGYTGSRAIIGNVEGGLVWDGHETLNDGRVGQYVRWAAGTTFTYDSHATMVGGTMVADGALDNGSPTSTGPGIAFGAELWSGQIATSFGSGGSFGITGNSLLYPLMVMGETGLTASGVVGGPGARTVDVINSSWASATDTGNSVINAIYDHLANVDGVTMVIAAGNSGAGAGTIGAPANGWNVIAVGATNGSAEPETVTSFSSGGPTGSFSEPGTRTKPDLVAPGLSILMPSKSSPTSFSFASGTSFAAPITAAGATLLIDYGKDTARSTDPRLVKALLMNSAVKLDGWAQEAAVDASGTRINYTPVDDRQGTGELNLGGVFGLYNSASGSGLRGGAADVIGWDLSTVAAGTPKDYLIKRGLPAGGTVTATLTWFMDRSVVNWDPNSASPYSDADFFNDSFDDLDLLLYHADANGQPTGAPVAASISGWDPLNPTAPAVGWDSVEHLAFTIPEAGQYVLRVRWTQEIFDFVADANVEDFALAWSITGYPGDLNFDGAVDISDLALLAGNFRRDGLTWRDGDLTGDGVVDVADLALLAAHFRQTVSVTAGEALPAGTSWAAGQTFSDDGSAAAPEPAAMALLALGGIVLVRRPARTPR